MSVSIRVYFCLVVLILNFILNHLPLAYLLYFKTVAGVRLLRSAKRVVKSVEQLKSVDARATLKLSVKMD